MKCHDSGVPTRQTRFVSLGLFIPGINAFTRVPGHKASFRGCLRLRSGRKNGNTNPARSRSNWDRFSPLLNSVEPNLGYETRCWMNMVMAEDNSQIPPPIPRTPYSAGAPPEKTFSSAIIKPNIPPKKKTHTITLRSVFSIFCSILIGFSELPAQPKFRPYDRKRHPDAFTFENVQHHELTGYRQSQRKGCPKCIFQAGSSVHYWPFGMAPINRTI